MTSKSGEKIDVAIKTLKEAASMGDKIKFLQEAAIMGQFSHPNVVKLYGVVTKGEPVSAIYSSHYYDYTVIHFWDL